MGRLQTARLENFIRRWGSIKGPGSVLSETLGDVFPVLDLENLTPENMLPAGWHLVYGFATIIGVAAQLSTLQAFVPAGSGAIAVIDKVVINSELAQAVTLSRRVAVASPVINMGSIDTRAPSDFNGTLTIQGTANGVSPITGIRLNVLAGVDREFEVPSALAVLSPNTQFGVVSGTANSDMTVSFIGRVRLAEPSELSF